MRETRHSPSSFIDAGKTKALGQKDARHMPTTRGMATSVISTSMRVARAVFSDGTRQGIASRWCATPRQDRLRRERRGALHEPAGIYTLLWPQRRVATTPCSLKYGSSSSLVRSAGDLRRTSCAVRRQQRALLRLLAEPGRGPQLEPAAGDAALGSSLGHGHGSAAERDSRARQKVWGPQLHPVAEATRRLITPEDLNKRDEVLKLFIKKKA